MTSLDALKQDVRLAVRTSARDPGFAAAAVITLAFGIGLAAAMFTVFDAVLRRPLPVQEQERVVVLWGEADGSLRRLPLHYEHFERFRQNPHTLQEVAGVLNMRASRTAVRDGERALTLNVAPVTGNFFGLLGSPPFIGRTLRPDDDVEGAERVAVISHGLWRRRFGGNRDVIGRRLTLHERELTYTVVGVAQPGLEYPGGADLWVPLVPFIKLEVVPLGRLAAHATPAQAAAELRASFEREDPINRGDLRAAASSLRDVVIGNVRPALFLLSAAAALLLLIACVNVANLLLARASGRMPEIATRHALGASRGRILRQLLTESSVLAVAGGLLGALLAVGLVRGLLILAPPELPRLEEIRLTGVPLWIAAGITGAATLAFGLFPALFASRAGASSLRASNRSSTAPKGRRRAQHALVVFQIALAVIVLVAASLLGRSLRELERLDMGFISDRLAIVQLARPGTKFESPAQVRALYDRLIPRLEALPGVVSVASLSLMPFGGAMGGIDGHFVAEGKPEAAEATRPLLNMEVVGPGYFRTLDIPLLRGRPLTDADRENSPRAVVVSETVARLFWPAQDAVGKRLGFGQPKQPEDWWTVVGVVPETRYRAMREPLPTVYLPHRQFAGASFVGHMLAIRTSGEPAAVLPSIRHAVQETDPDVLVTEAQTMARLLAGELAQPRLSAVLLGVFGIGALLLAGVGLYAMLAYIVRRRTRELAIRHALGASPSRLRALVLRQGAMMTGAGILLGLATALAGGSVLQSLLFCVSPADPLTLAGVPLVLLVVALAACYIPAQRATRADPVAVLRADY
ncbi:MAG: FtsX-like permease family protein [Luteitalea sp.]|nr:FtsX-like permease family protein [Luteitalea sp.]